MTIIHGFTETWRQVLRNRTLVSTMLLAVILYAFYYPAPYSHQVAQSLPVIIVDEENSAATRAIIRDLDATRSVEIVGQAASVEEARRRMREGDADGVVLLSRGLMRTLRTGAPGGGLAVWVNAMYSLRASTIGAAFEKVLLAQPGAFSGERVDSDHALGPPISVVQEPLFNRTAGYKGYIFPAVAVIIAHQTLLFGTATFVAGRRRDKTRRMTSGTFLGTWAALTSIGCLGTLFLFGFAFWLQDVPRGGATSSLLVAVPVFAGAVAAIGMLIGSYMDRAERAMFILAPTSVPFFFLSGTAWTLDQMPVPVAWLSHLVPSTSGVHLFVALNQMSASIAEAQYDLWIVLGLAGGYGALAWRRLAS